MGYFRQFDERFDSLTGVAPDHPFRSLPGIVERARALLSNRNRQQIVSASQSIDWFIQEYFREKKERFIRRLVDHGGPELAYLPEDRRDESGIRELFDSWPGDADDRRPNISDGENTTELAALKECIGGYNLDDAEFPNGQEFEYFAVLALRLISDAIEWLAPSRSEPFKAVQRGLQEDAGEAGSLPEEPANLSLAGECAMQAMDALGWAEHVNATEPLREELRSFHKEKRRQLHPSHKHAQEIEIERLVKERVSVSASKAAIKRHAEHHAMKAEVWEWCAKHRHEYPSMDRAAEAIAGTLVPVSVRTARLWVGEWAKHQRSARTP